MDISWMPKNMQKKFAGKGLGDIVKESIDTISAEKLNNVVGVKRQALLNKMLKFNDVIEEDIESEGFEKEDRLHVLKKESLL